MVLKLVSLPKQKKDLLLEKASGMVYFEGSDEESDWPELVGKMDGKEIVELPKKAASEPFSILLEAIDSDPKGFRKSLEKHANKYAHSSTFVEKKKPDLLNLHLCFIYYCFFLIVESVCAQIISDWFCI